MSISSKNTIVQAKITKSVFTLVQRYCKLSGLSISQYCSNAIAHQVYSDFIDIERNYPSTFNEVSLEEIHA